MNREMTKLNRLTTVNETAALLNTTRQFVYGLISSGKIKGFKSDTGKYLIFSDSVDLYIETCYNTYTHKCVASGGN